MSYIKTFIISIAVALSIIFMIQNIESLNQPLIIRLNLIFLKFESSSYATYLIILTAFFLGLLIASLLGIMERFCMRKEIKNQRKKNEILTHEINSLHNLSPVNKSLTNNNTL